MPHHVQDLITLFEQTFFEHYNTRLIKGADEPLYLPASDTCAYHQIIFAHGYYESAFHEISHWCHAGEKRRLLEDFGYWYVPDGRNEQQQQAFEHVEVIPQAIEWAFNVAAQKKFNVSVDNLNGHQGNVDSFKHNVYQQVKVFSKEGFPPRAEQFIAVLCQFYNTSYPLQLSQFTANASSTADMIDKESVCATL